MTESQIYTLIEKNKLPDILVKDYAGNKLFEIHATTPPKAVAELSDMLPSFRGYRKVEVFGKRQNDVAWTKGFCWQLEFIDTVDTTKTVGQSNNGGIGAMEFIAMMKENMQQNFNLQSQLIEEKLKRNDNDPSKWVGVIKEIAPMLGWGSSSNAMAGPKKQDLVLGDVDTAKMTMDEISQLVMQKVESIAKKVKPNEMIHLMSAIDNNEALSGNVEKISYLLNKISTRPDLLDTAVNFLK